VAKSSGAAATSSASKSPGASCQSGTVGRRWKKIGKRSGGQTSQNVGGVSQSGSTARKRVSTPSPSRKSRTNSPCGSSPTRETIAVATPSRASPVDTLPANPPTNRVYVRTSRSGVRSSFG
jgi:hypothetical protein